MIRRNKPTKKTKVEQRVSKLDSGSLLSWSEQSLYGIGKCLSSYQKNRSQDELDEALLASECLYVIMKELKARSMV